MRSSPYRSAARPPDKATADPEVPAWSSVFALLSFAGFVWLFREPQVAPEASGCFACLVVLFVAAASAKKGKPSYEESGPPEQAAQFEGRDTHVPERGPSEDLDAGRAGAVGTGGKKLVPPARSSPSSGATGGGSRR